MITGTSFGGGSGPIWLDDLDCNGNESSILNCSHKAFGVNNCGHDEDVAIQCMSGEAHFVSFFYHFQGKQALIF